jgi:hypothetical protein
MLEIGVTPTSINLGNPFGGIFEMSVKVYTSILSK